MKNIVSLVNVEEDRGLYYPVIDVNGETLHCRLITSKNSDADFAGVVSELGETLIDWATDDENNYGLGFHACGYSGPAQQRFSEYFEEEYGVYVF